MRIRSILFLNAVLLTGVLAHSRAEESAYNQGDKILQVGGGLFFGGAIIGPAVFFEYGVHEFVTAGGGIGFSSYSTKFFGDDQFYWRYMVLPIVARGAFHPFNLPVLVDKIPVRDKIDVYAGVSLGIGFRFSKWHHPANAPYDYATPKKDGGVFPIAAPLIGARYYFSPNFAAFVEEGTGAGWLNGGISLKF